MGGSSSSTLVWGRVKWRENVTCPGRHCAIDPGYDGWRGSQSSYYLSLIDSCMVALSQWPWAIFVERLFS